MTRRRPILRKRIHADMSRKEFTEQVAVQLDDLCDQLDRIEDRLATPWWRRHARSLRRS